MRASARGESALLLLDVLDVLKARAVKYAVVGAMAGAVHGAVRASLDADAIVHAAAQEAPDLLKQFAETGFDVELKKGDYDDPIAAVLTVKDKFKNRVDLLFGLKGFDRDAFDRAVQAEFSGESLRVVSCEDFIAMKLYAGGPVDVRDASQAYFVNRDAIDVLLLKKLTAKFGRDAKNQLASIFREFGATKPSPEP